MTNTDNERAKFMDWANSREGVMDASAMAYAMEGWLARAEAEGWRPIETAPKDGTRVRLKFESGREKEGNWQSTYGGEWHVDSFTHLPWDQTIKITHWRPLPAPPKEDEE